MTQLASVLDTAAAETSPSWDYDDVSVFLKVPKGTLRAWVLKRQIPHVRLSERAPRFIPSEIRQWVEKKRQPAEKASKRRSQGSR